jgi:tetratricopeptide (TPR) repeat protein
MTQSWRSWGALAGLLCLLATVSFGSLTTLGLDNHDRDNFLDSAAVSQDFSYLFSTDKHHPSGRPLFELIIWSGYALWGEDTRFFHLLGVVWHIGAALLLALLCQRLGWAWRPSAAAALLFFYTVSHFRAIHWISAQCYIVSFLLLIAGLLAYLTWSEGNEKKEGNETQQQRAGALFYLCLLAGLFVHTSTAVLLPLSAALAWSRHHPLRPTLFRLIPATLAGGLSTAAIRLYYANAPQVGQLGGIEPLAQAKSLLYMAGRLLSTAHALPIPPYAPTGWDWAAGALVLGGSAYLCWRRVFWGAWVPLCLAPFLVLAPQHILGLQAGPSRYLYAASAGIAALSALGFSRLADTLGKGAWGYLPLLPLLCLSHFQLKQSEGVSYFISGRSYISQQENEAAIAALEKATRLAPQLIPLEDVYGRLLNTRLSMGKGVEPLLSQARHSLPQSRILQLLAAVMATEVQKDAALQRIDQLIETQKRLGLKASAYDLQPMAGTFFANRGTGLVNVDSAAKAAVALRHALRYDPQQKTALKSIAYLLAKRGQLRQAGAYWSAGGDKPQALKAWRAAIATNPQDWQSRIEMASLLVRLGQLDPAREQYDIVLAAGPNMLARFESGLLHLTQRNDDAAQRDFSLLVERFSAKALYDAGLVQKLRKKVDDLPGQVGQQILKRYWPTP